MHGIWLEYNVILCLSIIFWSTNSTDIKSLVNCRDPDVGEQTRRKNSEKKFLIVGGLGAGIGNFLIFYPAAFYYAALTGRAILIADSSLIAEMCGILYCGFPLLSEMSSAFPSVLTPEKLKSIRGAKAWDFQSHFGGGKPIEDTLVAAAGYMYKSGWYLGFNQTEECVAHLTGCKRDDISCHDRHALQKLVRGPFRKQISELEESRIVGVPKNLKHGILSLPHSYAPRLDAAIHLRCQFKHFEYLVGPEDTLWPSYMKELDEFLHSKEPNAGIELFKAIESKIMDELSYILHKRNTNRYRRLDGSLDMMDIDSVEHLNFTENEMKIESDVYSGDVVHDRIYVYLASDNERVKEAFAKYLVGHSHISVMRLKNENHIVHAKNLDYLKRNSSGVMDLILDWYSLSLANVIFAWRRDTDLISTFAQSAQRVSGNIGSPLFETIESQNVVNENKTENQDAMLASIGNRSVRGFQLVYKNRRPIWKDF